MAPNITQKLYISVTDLHDITPCEFVAKTAQGVLLSSQHVMTTWAMGWLRSFKVKEG